MSNLLSNAIEFAKEGGGEGGISSSIITITPEKKDIQVIVKVKDTGTTIDSEILPQLFSKFASKSFQGIGLGLFNAKSIVEAHSGGKKWAENNNNTHREKGSTFTLLYQSPIDYLM